MYLNTRLKQYLLSSFFQATTNIYWINELPFTLIFQSGPNHRRVKSDRLNQTSQNMFKKVIICNTCRTSDYACYGSGFEQSLLQSAIFRIIVNVQRGRLMIPVRPVITVPETFFFSIFFVRSSCAHSALTVHPHCAHRVFTCAFCSAPFALTVNKALTVRSLCVHKAFTLRSLFVQR